MIVEGFFLMRKYSQLKKQRDTVVEGYQEGDGTQDVKALSTLMLVIIIVGIVLFLISIFAMVDAAKNCGENKMLHILLLFFVPAYLPLYIILRSTGSICSK